MKHKLAATAILIAIWEIVYLAINNNSLFAGPFATFAAMGELLKDKMFYQSIKTSFVKVAAGYAAASMTGSLLASAAWLCKTTENILSPIMAVIKSIPAISFIIIALMYMNAGWLPMLVSFVIVLPVFYFEIHKGLCGIDAGIMDMSHVFGLERKKKFAYIYLYSIRHSILSAVKSTTGLAWKSSISAELIALATPSIGEKLYEAKIYFEPDRLFAWTFVIVILCVCCEKILCLAIKKFFEKLESF